MKIDFSNKKKLVLALCLAGLALAVVTGGTLAIYTSQVFQRSVVRNRNNDVIRFSSDKLYLEPWSENEPGTIRTFYYPMGEGQTSMSFRVCNYDQTRSTLLNEKPITYDITFTVLEGKADATYTIVSGSSTLTLTNQEPATVKNQVLTGGEQSFHSYTFTFPSADDPCKLKVVVRPHNSYATQNKMLCGILSPAKYATKVGFSIGSQYPDRSYPLNQLAAYNLLISVTSGIRGDVCISWNPEILDIDPYFIEGKTMVNAADGWKSITMEMDAMGETATVSITFYNHNHQVDPAWTWDNLPIRVEALDQT